jgi:hypothetical protein
MMFFTFVLAAASCNVVTAAAENYHSVLRGNLPSDTVESLADAHGRMLGAYQGNQAALAVMSEAGIIFTHPPSTIHGDVCADSAFTGDESTETIDLDFKFKNGGEAFTGGCGPTYLKTLLDDAKAKKRLTINAELGGKTFPPGTYYSASLTVAANTKVYLDGGPNDIFLFLSGSTFATGANTQILLTGDDLQIGNAKAENVLFATISAATTGAELSKLQGSILAGSAVTLGEGSEVEGYVLAKADLSVGANCTLNTANIGETVVSPYVSPVSSAISKAVCPNADGFTNADDYIDDYIAPYIAPYACTAGCSDVCETAAGCFLIDADGSKTDCEDL